MQEQDQVFVTDVGSVVIDTKIYMPSEEIPLAKFKGRKLALKELILDGKVSKRRRRVISDQTGRVIKRDRSVGAVPVPRDMALSTSKTLRDLPPPIRSTSGNTVDIHQELGKVRNEQVETEREGIPEEDGKVALSVATVSAEEMAELAEMTEELDNSLPMVDNSDLADGTEMLEEDMELVNELDDEDEDEDA